MNPEDQKLEPVAEAILDEIRSGATAAKVADTDVHTLSAALSAKRSADALERIATKLESVDPQPFFNQLLDIAYQAGVNFKGGAGR